MLDEEFTLHFPSAGGRELSQDEEYFEINDNGSMRRVRFHDYAEIYSIPGLYERLFSEELCCRSPQVVVELLHATLVGHQRDATDLRVLDFGAGNGMVAEELAKIGAERIVGIDELQEARDAADRDRPGVYDDYYALDVTDPDPAVALALEQVDFNCMTCVAALGFGDIPPDAFRAAFELVSDDGWIAFNIRDRFVDGADRSGFADLLDEMTAGGELVSHARMRYPHRRGISGEPLNYVAVVAQKADPAVT